MLAVSTGSAVCLFDYESALTFVNTIQADNVSYMTFIDVNIVLLSESADGSECTLKCYSIDGKAANESITIKQFMGNQIMVRPSEQSIIFACGN